MIRRKINFNFSLEPKRGKLTDLNSSGISGHRDERKEGWKVKEMIFDFLFLLVWCELLCVLES